MLLDFAPLEGITGAAFRRLHHRYFPGVDRYYTPFLSPTREHRFTPREQREFFPEYQRNVTVVPQILTKVPEDFLWAAQELHAMGYQEVNLNAGCPSGTVTAKGKGAGLLADLETLEQFLDAIFEQAPCPISIKTRLGIENPDEFVEILELYNRYPVSELIIHPRVRKDFYRHPVRLEAYEQALQNCRCPVSYNGSIITPEDYRNCISRYPNLKAVMIGQGLVSDPFLAGKIACGLEMNRAVLQEFVEELLEAYALQFDSLANAAKRMKDLWFYLIRLFADSERHGKKILKAKTPEEYQSAVSAVFRELPLLENSAGGW